MKNNIKFTITILLASMMLILSACSGGKKGKQLVSSGDMKVYENEMYYQLFEGLQKSGISDDNFPKIEEVKKQVDEMAGQATYKDFINKQKGLFITKKIANEKILKIAKEQNITLTDEEKKVVSDQVEEMKKTFTSEELKENLRLQFYPNDQDVDDKAKAKQMKRVNEYIESYKSYLLGSYGVSSFDDIKTVLEQETLFNKVLDQVGDKIPDDEEKVKAYYESQLKKQKAKYDEDINNFASDLNSEITTVYYPSGLRKVKHILIKFNEDDEAKLSEFKSKIAELKSKDELSEEEKKTLEETQAKYDELNKKAQEDAKKKADEVYAKLKSGANFDEMIKEFGQDPGMAESSKNFKDGGYIIYENNSTYDKDFTKGAMSLNKVGEYTQPVLSSFGYHIIQYSSDVTAGAVPFETIRESILTTAMESERSSAALKFFVDVLRSIKDDKNTKINYKLLGITEEEFNVILDDIILEYDNKAAGGME